MNKNLKLLLIVSLCLLLGACSVFESKRPVDYNGSEWFCESAGMEFSVSEGEVTNAVLKDKNGDDVSVTVIFSDIEESKMSVINAESGEKLFEGDCTFAKKEFKLRITDFYGTKFEYLQKQLSFKRK